MHYVKKEEVARLRVIMSIIKNFFRRGSTRSLMCTNLQQIILFLWATLLKIRVWYTVPKTHKRHHHEHNHMCSQTFTTLLHYLPCLVFDNYTVIYFIVGAHMYRHQNEKNIQQRKYFGINSNYGLTFLQFFVTQVMSYR